MTGSEGTGFGSSAGELSTALAELQSLAGGFAGEMSAR